MSYQSLVHGSLTSETHTSWKLNWLVAETFIMKSRPMCQEKEQFSLSYIIIALAPELLHCLVDATVPLLNKLRAQVCDEMSYSIPTADSVTLYSEWQQSKIKSGGLKIKLDIPFFFTFAFAFVLANLLAIATPSMIVSANVLWQWTSMQLFNWSCFSVFLRYVLCFVASQSGKTSLQCTCRDFNNGSWSLIQQN